MKLLPDENLPHQMRLELAGHEVVTTAYMNRPSPTPPAALETPPPAAPHPRFQPKIAVPAPIVRAAPH